MVFGSTEEPVNPRPLRVLVGPVVHICVVIWEEHPYPEAAMRASLLMHSGHDYLRCLERWSETQFII